MGLIDDLRQSRLVSGDLSILDSAHVAYLGLYNAERYLNSISLWLAKMDNKDIPLIIVDNNSDDQTWDLAIKEISRAYPNSVFVKHPINLGGYGGLATNFDLLTRSEWVTTFHQDDVYAPGHLSIHRALALVAAPNLGIISSEQQSFLPTGEKLGFPRASWLMDSDPDPVTMFLANLNHHTLPFSGASLRLPLLRQLEIPWHSTAFPDTEIVLRMLPAWTGTVTDRVIVNYLENPISESHSTPDKEKDLGARMALIRVFGSDGFRRICNMVQPEDMPRFVDRLIQAIRFRVSQDPYADDTVLIALEYMFQSIGPHPAVVEQIERHYGSIQSKTTTNLLHRLHSFGVKDSRLESCAGVVDSFVEGSEGGQVRGSGAFKVVLARALGILPTQVRKFFVRAILWLGKRFGLRSSWDFDWKG